MRRVAVDDGLTFEQLHRVIQRAMGSKRKLRYRYDFGNDWRHTIAIEKRLPADAERDAILDGWAGRSTRPRSTCRATERPLQRPCASGGNSRARAAGGTPAG